MNKYVFLLLGILLTMGCIKEEYRLDENLQVEGLDPSFAIPLVNTTLNLGNLESEFDSQNFVYNEDEETFALVYSEDLFRVRANDLSLLESQNLGFDYTLDAGEAAAISSLPSGSSTSLDEVNTIDFNVGNGAELDSVVFTGGGLEINASSTIPHNLELSFTIPSLTLNGIPFSSVIDLSYPGNTPFSDDASFDLTGYVLDLTNGGVTNNQFDVELTANITTTGEQTDAGDFIDFAIDLDVSEFEGIYGYFSQYEIETQVDTQFVDLFKDLNGGILHFADPRIDLTITNSTGIPAGVEFSGVFAPENNVDQQMGGPDLSNFPVIAAANFLGDEVITTHSFTNAGTSPTLTEILDEGPFELIYTSTLTTNPEGPIQNFLQDTSEVSCRVDMILPFFGFADNFSLKDTSSLDISAELGVGDEEELDWEDVEKVTIRIIATNGLPIQLEGQLYFTDSLHNVIDSLFNNQYEAIFQQGFVDFSLPTNDPNYGRVLTPTQKITDVVISRDKLRKLVDEEATRIILTSRANTNAASNGEIVRFYPEYNLKLKVSAKIDTDISINE